MGEPGHGLPGGLAGGPGGAGEGAISGVNPGAPSRSKAAGELAPDDGRQTTGARRRAPDDGRQTTGARQGAEDDRGPDLPLGTIVGGGHAAVGQEQEVLASPGLDLGPQFAAGAAGGRDRQAIVEPAGEGSGLRSNGRRQTPQGPVGDAVDPGRRLVRGDDRRIREPRRRILRRRFSGCALGVW